MASMTQIVFRAPKAPIDIHYYSGRFFTFGFTLGKTKLSELIGVLAVGEACIGWRRSLGQDIFRRHENYSTTEDTEDHGEVKNVRRNSVLSFQFLVLRRQLHYQTVTPAI